MVREPEITLPRIGMVATVRNRRGVISTVRPLDGPGGALHLLDIEYNDGETPLGELDGSDRMRGPLGRGFFFKGYPWTSLI